MERTKLRFLASQTTTRVLRLSNRYLPPSTKLALMKKIMKLSLVMRIWNEGRIVTIFKITSYWRNSPNGYLLVC